MKIVFGKRLQRLRRLEQAAARMVEASDRLGNGWDEGGEMERTKLWGALVRATCELDEAVITWDPR